jgi:hypothetical protein
MAAYDVVDLEQLGRSTNEASTPLRVSYRGLGPGADGIASTAIGAPPEGAYEPPSWG